MVITEPTKKRDEIVIPRDSNFRDEMVITEPTKKKDEIVIPKPTKKNRGEEKR